MIDRIVFWGVCAILVFVPLPIGSVEEWSIFAFEAATIGLFLVFVGDRIFRWGRPRHRPMPDASDPDALAGRLPLFFKVLVGVFLAFSVLQIVPLPEAFVGVFSPRAYGIYAGLVKDAVLAPSSRLTLSLAPGASLGKLVLMVCYGLFGYLVLRTVRSRRRAEIMVGVVLVSALFQSIYGMAETFSGHNMLLGRPKKYFLDAVTGTFVNRNHFAGFLEMAFPLSLGYLLTKSRYFATEKGMTLRQRVLWFGQESLQWTLLLGLVPVFIGTGLVFSQSRSGIMVLAVTGVLALTATAYWREVSGARPSTAASPAGRRGLGGPIKTVLFLIFAAAVGLGVGPVLERFSQSDISTEARRAIYRGALQIVRDFPLAGTGKATFVNAYAMVEKVDDRQRQSFAHNDYLEYLSENGVIGGGALILAGAGLLIWLVVLWRRRRSGFAKGIGLGAILGVTALFLHGFTDFNLQITANAVYFTALAMLAAAVLAKGERAGVSGGAPAEAHPSSPDEAGPGAKRSVLKVRIGRPRVSRFGLPLAATAAVVILIPAVRDYLGFHDLAVYHRARAEARSVEGAFPSLEPTLLRAAAASPRAVFQSELARLYMEMARVANDAGREEDRDTFCDKAVARYGQAIAANPIDAGTHYEMATAYLLYNFPLMTYQDRAKAYFRQALVFKPADETVNLNVQFLYFSWWPTLEDGDRAYAAGLYRKMLARDPGFASRLEARWVQSYGSPDGLRAALAALPPSL